MAKEFKRKFMHPTRRKLSDMVRTGGEFDKNTQKLRDELVKKYNINMGASKEEDNEYEGFDYTVVL